MRHGENYNRYLEGELAHARERSHALEKVVSDAETSFCKVLPPDETPLQVSTESLRIPEVVARREAYREAHAKYSHARTSQGTIEDEYFRFPEDFH